MGEISPLLKLPGVFTIFHHQQKWQLWKVQWENPRSSWKWIVPELKFLVALVMVSYQVAIQKATKGDLQSIPQKKPAILPQQFSQEVKKISCFLNGWLVVDLPL